MKDKKVLVIIEEIGEITTSGAIVNWNLCRLLGPMVRKMDVLTLDNISEELLRSWNWGDVHLHPKDNLSGLQKFIVRIPKIRGLIQLILGNDFFHHNRKNNIEDFLTESKGDYDTVLLLSGGAGFSPHLAINRSNFNNFKIIAVFHDPYPLSCFPAPYRKSNSFSFSLKRYNIQKCLDKIDIIVFPSQRLYEWYLNDYRINGENVKIIPHAVNYDYLATRSESSNNGSATLITHTGTLLGPRNPYTFLKVVSEINNQNLQLEFYGNVETNVAKQINKFRYLNNIIICNKRIEYTVALEKLHSSDFLLIVEAASKDSPFLPTKFVDYVNINKPIIALTSSNSEITRLLGESYPLKCDLNDEDEIREILTTKIFNRSVIKTSMKALVSLKKYFSADQIRKSYSEIL